METIRYLSPNSSRKIEQKKGLSLLKQNYYYYQTALRDEVPDLVSVCDAVKA